MAIGGWNLGVLHQWSASILAFASRRVLWIHVNIPPARQFKGSKKQTLRNIVSVCTWLNLRCNVRARSSVLIRCERSPVTSFLRFLVLRCHCGKSPRLEHEFCGRLELESMGLQRKHKKDDPDDVALNEGRSYFVESTSYKSYLTLVGEAPVDSGVCYCIWFP